MVGVGGAIFSRGEKRGYREEPSFLQTDDQAGSELRAHSGWTDASTHRLNAPWMHLMMILKEVIIGEVPVGSMHTKEEE